MWKRWLKTYSCQRTNAKPSARLHTPAKRSAVPPRRHRHGLICIFLSQLPPSELNFSFFASHEWRIRAVKRDGCWQINCTLYFNRRNVNIGQHITGNVKTLFRICLCFKLMLLNCPRSFCVNCRVTRSLSQSRGRCRLDSSSPLPPIRSFTFHLPPAAFSFCTPWRRHSPWRWQLQCSQRRLKTHNIRRYSSAKSEIIQSKSDLRSYEPITLFPGKLMPFTFCRSVTVSSYLMLQVCDAYCLSHFFLFLP